MHAEQVNENTLIIYVDLPPGEQSIGRVNWLNKHLLQHYADAVLDTVPAANSLMVVCDTALLPLVELVDALQPLSCRCQHQQVSPQGADITIPVFYDARVGPDLQTLAAAKGMPVEELVRRHTETTFLVHALGFLPGFAYLGGLPATLHAPRLATPRAQVIAGSLGIAENYTGIYPRNCPGGWNIIGRTPAKMLADLRVNQQPKPNLLSVGDRVRFHAISEQEYLGLGGYLNGE